MSQTIEYTEIPVTSLTYALKGQKLLQQCGIMAWAGRDHQRTSGCGYQLTVRGDAEKARRLLEQNGIKIKQLPQGGTGR